MSDEKVGEVTGTKKIVVLALTGTVVALAIAGAAFEPVRSYAVGMISTFLTVVKGLL